MLSFQRRLTYRAIILFFTISAACPSIAQTVNQTITLTPGWNAVYLEVEPATSDCGTVFRDIPVLSVWWWDPRTDTVEFIQDPDTLVPEQQQWRVYFPSYPKNILTNLFAIQGGMPYLIHLDGTETVQWTVTGRPCLPKIDWKTDSLNLVGFHLEEGNEPLFGDFFSASSAHDVQKIYIMNAAGDWTQVTDPATTFMKRGEAFWIHCKGSSDFTGPLDVSLEQGETVDYADSLVEQTVRIGNQSAADYGAVTVTLTGNVPLNYWKYAPESNEAGWTPLPVDLPIPAGGQNRLRLAVDRTNFEPTETRNGIIEIRNSAGMQILLPVSAQGTDKTGLWVGHAVINKVSLPTRSDPPEIPATGSEAQIRLIVHQDSDGTVRLLKQVSQVWEGDDTNGRFVLTTATDAQTLENYSGSTMRDGRRFGRRVSSAAFGFSEFIVLSGSISVESDLTGVHTISETDALNPYRHKYHPDHKEGIAVTRYITLAFEAEDPTGLSLSMAGWGDTYMGGTYREKITGLSKPETTEESEEAIWVEGIFRLHKVSDIGNLN